MLGGGYVNYFSLDQRSYKVIPQVERRYRLNTDQLLNYYVANVSGTPVPLSTIAKISTKGYAGDAQPFPAAQQRHHPGRGRAGRRAVGCAGFSQRSRHPDVAARLRRRLRRIVPAIHQESSGFVATFGFALVIIFLSLAALFESFRDPCIILVSVPMSIADALIFVSLGIGGASLNIYTDVGLVTLMGLISKHGILIVEFANELQLSGTAKREAIEQAAGIRLRPILMTTAAMVFGVIPLILASGAGAVSRFNMGLVIASGLAIGTLFTLFVVPAIYLLIATDHAREFEPRASRVAPMGDAAGTA
jgi:multidrug efflux pump